MCAWPIRSNPDRPFTGKFTASYNLWSLDRLLPSILSAPRICAQQPREIDNGGIYMFSLLWTALIGLVVGALAKLIMPGKDPGGIFITIILGIAGAFLGTCIGRAVGPTEPGQSAGFIMSQTGAPTLLGIYHLIKRRQAV